MWNRFFDPDNLYWRWMSKFTDVLCLSLLWLVLSLPLFTLGAATTALYDASVRCVRGSEPRPYGRFFRTFRSEFKTSTLITLLCGAAFLLFWMGDSVLTQAASGGARSARVMLAAYSVALFLPAGVLCWLFPLLSRFTCTAGGLIRTAVQFTFLHLPSTFILVLLTIEAANFCIRFLAPFLFMPCVTVLLWSLFMERIFTKHTPPSDSSPME